MNYEQWELGVPLTIREDTLWKIEAYRLSLFLGDLAWEDLAKLRKDRRSVVIADQLQRAVASIGANIAEGYSRSTGKERARFYEFSCGSAREARHWYYTSRKILGEAVSSHRLTLITRLIRLTLT